MDQAQADDKRLQRQRDGDQKPFRARRKRGKFKDTLCGPDGGAFVRGIGVLRKDEGGRMKDEEKKRKNKGQISSFILPPSSFFLWAL